MKINPPSNIRKKHIIMDKLYLVVSRKSILLLSLMFLFFCPYVNVIEPSSANAKSFNQNKKIQLYELLADEIKQQNASNLKECNCMKALHRNLFEKPDNTARYIFDQKVGVNAVEISKSKSTINVLAIGSGTLLNELSAFSNILARNKNLNIYLIDYAYIFYGDKNFQRKAINFGKNPEQIPENWKEFYFWDLYKSKKEPYLPFFEKHHIAINQFKKIIDDIARHYGVTVTINILKPPTEQPINLSGIDMIISIDSFIDVPNLMWNLYYQIKTNNNRPIRFIALNKTKPLGGFWNSPNLSKREQYSLKPVTIDIYDIKSTANYGSYKLIEKIKFEPNKEQLNEAMEFIKKPDRDTTQSPLDMNK